MKLQLNIKKVIETIDDLGFLTDIQKLQLTYALGRYFGNDNSNLQDLFSKNSCVTVFMQVVDTSSSDTLLYDFWEVNFDSGTLFLPNSVELAGIKKLQNSFCLNDGFASSDLEEIADKLNIAKKVKLPEPIKAKLNNNNEIIEFKDEQDIPQKATNWKKFLQEYKLSEELVNRYRQVFNEASWRLILNKTRLSESFLESFAPDIGWKLISEYKYLSESFIHQHEQSLDWKVMSANQKFSEKQIIDHQDKLDWLAISWAQKLSPNLIEKFKDKINWESICMYQILDMDIITRNNNKFNKCCWQNISQKQTLSDDLLSNYSNKIDWGYASMNIQLTDKQLIEYSNNIKWNRLINYGRTLGYQQILDLVAKDCIAYDDIEDILNERKKFELTDEQVKELKKTIKLLKKKTQ